MLLPDTTFEKHYSIAEISSIFHLSKESIRKLLVNEPGCIRLRLGRTQKTRYSVPESIVRKLHARLLNGG